MAGVKSTYDKIYAWYKNPDKNPLTPQDIKIVERWDFIDNLFRRHQPKLPSATIVKMVMKKFAPISRSQAWADIKNSHRLYGSLFSVDKDFRRMIRVEWLEEIASKAEMKGDFKSAVAALKEANELEGLKNRELENIRPEDMQPHTYQLTLSAGEHHQVINLDQLNKIPEAQFEMVVDAVEGSTLTPEDMDALIDGREEPVDE